MDQDTSDKKWYLQIQVYLIVEKRTAIEKKTDLHKSELKTGFSTRTIF